MHTCRSRIINLQKLQDHLQDVINHTATHHPFVNKPTTQHSIVMKEQKREGLSSVLTSHCTSCNTDFNLTTSQKVKGISGMPYWESNLAAVWGQMSTGGGHTTLTETMAVLGIPTMTKKSFMAAEKRIGEWW